MSLYNEWVQQLKENERQKTAFERDTHTVVIAGPGSGKTRVLALKIAQLLRDEIMPPQGIACLTFTRIMAKELENRLFSLGVSSRQNLVVSTVHGFCLGQVLIPFSGVYDLSIPNPIRVAPSSIQGACLRNAFSNVIENGDYDDFKRRFNKYRPQRTDTPVNLWKNQKDIAQAISIYEQGLLKQGYVDFDLIVQAALRLIVSQDSVRQYLWARFPWFAVDEYQDLGYPLNRIVTEMVRRTDVKLFAIGDPDQSIFDFAGTDPKYLDELSKMDIMQPKIELEVNYRSKKEIIDIAQVFLGQTRNHRSEHHGGYCRIIECPQGITQQAQQIIELIKIYQQNRIPSDQIVIIHRRRRDLSIIAKALETAGIDYVVDKNELYDRQMIIIRWLEDLAYWCLKGYSSENAHSVNPRSSLDELLNTWLEFGYSQKLGFTHETNHARIHLADVLWNLRDTNQLFHDWLVRVDDSLDLSSILESYRMEYPDEVDEYTRLLSLIAPGQPLYTISLSKFANSSPCVQLTTIHSCKGTEFEVVIIAGVECVEKSKNGQRLLYVGATRAKSELNLLYTQSRAFPGARYIQRPPYILQLREQATNKGWKFVSHRIVR